MTSAMISASLMKQGAGFDDKGVVNVERLESLILVRVGVCRRMAQVVFKMNNTPSHTNDSVRKESKKSISLDSQLKDHPQKL